jgi:RNA polymerase sigma factor FliA
MQSCESSERADALVRQHLPLVQYAVSEVMGRVPRHVSRDELTSAAMLGLAQAAKAWDAGRGVSFDRYARNRIRGALLDELRSRDWASRSVRAEGRRLQAATEELGSHLGRMPTPAELGSRMGLRPIDVTALQDDIHRATVLHYDSVFLEGEDGPVLAGGAPEPMDDLLGREMRAYLHDAIVALPERLRRVVVGYFFEELPMAALADELGVTESRISQMRAEALRLLHDGMRSQLDPETLAEEAVTGRVARRKAAYYADVAAASTFRSRLEANPVPITQRVGAVPA